MAALAYQAGYAERAFDLATLAAREQNQRGRPADALKAHGIKKIDAVLLTHHHRDTCAAAGKYLADKVPVRAPKASAAWSLQR